VILRSLTPGRKSRDSNLIVIFADIQRDETDAMAAITWEKIDAITS